MYGARLERWNRVMEWPMIAAALIYMGCYAAQILGPQSDEFQNVTNVVLWIIWGLFLIEYVVCLVITEHRVRWFWRHLLDLLIVALPMFRPLRLMRFLTTITIIEKNVGTALRGRVAIYTVGATILTIFMASLAVLDAEQGQPGPTSRASAMRSGGRSRRSRPSAMATSTPSRSSGASSRSRSWSAVSHCSAS